MSRPFQNVHHTVVPLNDIFNGCDLRLIETDFLMLVTIPYELAQGSKRLDPFPVFPVESLEHFQLFAQFSLHGWLLSFTGDYSGSSRGWHVPTRINYCDQHHRTYTFAAGFSFGFVFFFRTSASSSGSLRIFGGLG